MARHKQYVKLKLPFFKKVKINRNTFSNIIGMLIFGCALLLLVSYIQTGEILILINDILRTKLGIVSILFPVIILMLSTHFFNSKKVKFIKLHATVGMLLIFISLLGFFSSGQIGYLIAESLYMDFSSLGKYVILFVTGVVGIILFFNTSIDAFLQVIFEAFKVIASTVSTYFVKPLIEIITKKAPTENRIGKGEFIRNSQPVVIHNARPMPVPQDASGNISIKPIAGEVAKNWVYPPLSLIQDVGDQKADVGDTKKNSDIIERTLDSFGMSTNVVEINQGPTVTQYALEIVMGTKLSKITGLSNDLALALAAPTGQVRIEAPIPGRSFVGIEIPNRRSEVVSLKRMLASNEMTEDAHPLTVPLGLDVSGHPIVTNIARMPHVLIAGTTGSGKSVLLNSWICSLLYRTTPQDVRLILVDPKRVELTVYNGTPHLLTPVIVEPDKIISALKWTVGQMEERYKMFSKAGARNIESYNEKKDHPPVPYIIFIIDELADLMIYAPGEAEENITRIAQMARATGIHLILATQRPSVDVITGLMKANIPARIAFNVASLIDSRVVLDMPGAEKLVGKGDMLFMPPDQAKPRRIQGPFLSENDVSGVVSFLKQKGPQVHYTEEVTEQDVKITTGSGKNVSVDGEDPLTTRALNLIYQEGKASASLLQRRLSVGYSRAARILDQLQSAGIIGPAQGSKPREILSRAPSSDTIEATTEMTTDQRED